MPIAQRRAISLKIIIYGPPCSGKTTIATEFSSRLSWLPRLSCREMCEREAERRTPDGIIWRECEDHRHPLPPGLVNRIADQYLRDIDSFLIEGYPKTLDEAKYFNSLTGGATHLFVLVTSPADVIKRASQRLECKNCRISFNMTAGVCPRCSRPGRRRQDDSPDIVPLRFAEYIEYSELALPILRREAKAICEGTCSELLNDVVRVCNKQTTIS